MTIYSLDVLLFQFGTSIWPVHPKGDQSWVFIGRTDVEAETPTLWPPEAKSWLIGKDPDAGKYWGQEKGTTEDEMVRWHHWLNGHGFGWTPGVGDGQGGLGCCGSWCHKESDMTEWLNWTVQCLVLIVTSWPAYRFLRRQVRWSGIPISWRIFHGLMWSTQSMEVDVFLELLLFLWPRGCGNLISDSSAFS